MKTTPKIEQNTGHSKRTSRTSLLTPPGNTHAHAPDVTISPVSHMSGPFTNMPPLAGASAQAILLRLAHVEAQLALNLISNFTAGNCSGYGNPFVLLCLLQAASQRTPFLYQPPSVDALSRLLHGRNMNSITHTVNPPSVTSTMMSSVTEISSVVTNKESWITGNLQAKAVVQETNSGLTSNSPVLQPTSKEPLDRPNTNQLGQKFSFKPSADSSRCKTVTGVKTSTVTSADRQVDCSRQDESKKSPSEHLSKALASLGLSLEDLELLSHCPDDYLTTEMLPIIIQDIQQRKGAKAVIHFSPESNMPKRVIEYDHASRISTDQTEPFKKSSYTYRKYYAQGYEKIRHSKFQENHFGSQSVSPSFSSSNSPALHSPYGRTCSSHTHSSLRSGRFGPPDSIHKHFSTQFKAPKQDSSGKRFNFFTSKASRRRPGSVYIPSLSIRRSFVSPEHNKTRTYTTQRPSSHNRSATSSDVRKGHGQLSFSSLTSEITTESRNIQTPVNRDTTKTSTPTRGVIRVSGIPPDYSEGELVKMTTPFGQAVEVLMATEVDTVTCLEWKKALMILPTELSAQEMVKVYSAIPPHMRQQSLELVSQTVDLTSPVSVFHAFVGPSISNGLLTPVERLLVVCNVPRWPCAAAGVLRLLKPFGKVFRTLVFCGNKVDVDQFHGNSDSVQMVLEMESAAAALSVYEWSQKIPCIYQNHHLSFLRGSNIWKNTPEAKSA